MNETTTDPGTPPGPAGGQPAPPPPHQDLDRLRRSVDDRYIAGVAGGLGRHFGIDPTVIRVLLAVLTLFGGAGVLIYGAVWMFVPEEGSDRAPIHTGSEPRKLILLAAVAVAFLLAMGDAFSGFNAWPIAGLAVIVAIVLIARDKKDGREAAQQPVPPTWAAAADTPAAASFADPAAAQPTPPAAPEDSALPPGPPAPPAPPAWQPPLPPRPPLVPPHAKRTGIVWFWPTLALIAISLGVLGVVDSGSTDVEAWVYPAVAVAVTGVMLLVGSFVGRPGGLILIGIVSTMALSWATALGGFHFDGRTIDETPRTAAAVQSSYTATNGRIELDLTQVADPENLAGRTIDITLKAGEILVYVPRSINVDIEADLEFAGGIQVPGYDGGGIQDSVDRQLVGTPATSDPALRLDLEATLGHISVEQR